MVTYKNLYENKNIEIVEAKGDIKVLEYKYENTFLLSNNYYFYFVI